jgi:hypothetical protein
MADTDELLEKAGGFFKKLGGQLKVTGKVVGRQLAETGKVIGTQLEQTGKQVTGLGRGTVKLELDQTRAAPGGTVRGRVVLALTEPVQAKRLVVTLRARQKYITVKTSDGKGVGATHAEVYQLDKELAPAQTFGPGSHPFELDVPPDALELVAKPPSGSNPLADVARTIASAVSPTLGPVEWEVIGRLEIAWGRDLADAVDLVITR